MLLSRKDYADTGEMLRITRALVAIAFGVVFISTTGAGCGQKSRDCPTGTAVFPIVGAVVKKSTPALNCYMLHIKRDDSSITETVRVSRYRYLHVEALGRVTYSAEPTD